MEPETDVLVKSLLERFQNSSGVAHEGFRDLGYFSILICIKVHSVSGEIASSSFATVQSQRW
jgi:hypothetical protein